MRECCLRVKLWGQIMLLSGDANQAGMVCLGLNGWSEWGCKCEELTLSVGCDEGDWMAIGYNGTFEFLTCFEKGACLESRDGWGGRECFGGRGPSRIGLRVCAWFGGYTGNIDEDITNWYMFQRDLGEQLQEVVKANLGDAQCSWNGLSNSSFGPDKWTLTDRIGRDGRIEKSGSQTGTPIEDTDFKVFLG